jgi:hypothetical protein
MIRFLVVASMLVVGIDASVAFERTLGRSTPGPERLSTTRPNAQSRLPRNPDIYYIVFDRYVGEGPLRTDLHFNNRPFLNFLRRKGFYVADQSRTNYPRTSFALGSVLNMRFMDDLADEAAPDETTAIYRRLHNIRVGRFLKARGYRYIHMGSWWEPTRVDPLADLNIKWSRNRRYKQLERKFDRPLRFREKEYLRRFFQFRQLSDRIPKLPGPKFVWAHFLCPHDPLVTDRHGRFVRDAERPAPPYFRDRGVAPFKNPPEKYRKPFFKSKFASKSVSAKFVRLYLEQVRWVNSQLRRLVNKLVSGPESSRPIVVIQADEGGPEAGLVPRNATSVSIRTLKRKFYILNALYLPGVRNPPLHRSVTSVNTFRAIFNLYFNTRYALLPDRSFVFVFKDYYRHLDVTEVLTRTPP